MSNERTRRQTTHASLFSGIGGAEVAARWMGWRNVFHCEIQEFPRRVLEYHFPESVGYGDITRTDFRPWRGRVDVLTGGFPCQPFSLAGKRLGAQDDRYLWTEMLRAIREIQPAWVVGENVAGILTMVEPGEAVALSSSRIIYTERSASSPSSASAETLNERDMPSSRFLFRLVPSVRPTAGTESGLLPTVQTQVLKYSDKKGKTRFYPTELLPTPKSQESRGNASKDRGKKNLTDEVAKRYKPDGESSQLNPLFVQEMMGFPSLWTELPFQSGDRNP